MQCSKYKKIECQNLLNYLATDFDLKSHLKVEAPSDNKHSTPQHIILLS